MRQARAAIEAALTTERLTLAPLAVEHAASLLPLLDDWDVVKMLAVVPWPVKLDDVRDFAASRERLADGSDFVLLLDAQPIGVCGIKHPGSGEPPRKMPRLGYWIGRRYWSRGFGTEALAALVRHAFAVFDAERIGAGVFADNPTSRRVLEKLGFREVGRYETPCRARGDFVETADMQIVRSDWLAGAGVRG